VVEYLKVFRHAGFFASDAACRRVLSSVRTTFNQGEENHMLLADFVLQPGGIAGWIVAGLIAGWLAGKVLQSPSYGTMGDLIIGTIGGLLGGALLGFFVDGQPQFWLAVLVAFIAACVSIGVVRTIVALRST
jgi:uncharacterized membrane protein YeaQ/YmgE (transglycosylase-associated protein family)